MMQQSNFWLYVLWFIAGSVIGAVVCFVVQQLLSNKEDYYTEVVDDDGSIVSQCRENIINHVLSIFYKVFNVTDDDSVSVQVEILSYHSDMVTISHSSLTLFCYFDWEKEKLLIIANTEKKNAYKRKAFKIESNFIDVEKLEGFYNTLKKEVLKPLKEKSMSDIYTDAVNAAKQLETSLNNEQVRNALYNLVANWEIDNPKSKKFDDSLKGYVVLLTYLLKEHKDDFLQFLRDAGASEEFSDEQEKEVE